MDLRLKAYLKAMGIVLGFIGGVFLIVFVANGIMGIDFMRENYQTIQQTIQNVLFKILLACMPLMVIVYIIGGIAESDIRGELQKLKLKEREKYEKQHKSDWQMRSVYILTIAMFVLAMMIALCGLGANIENPSNQNNQSVSTLDINN